jgi:uncharacterized protein involved in cysteine biosynthesis
MKLLAENVGKGNSCLQRYCLDENQPSHLVDLVTFIPIINLIMFPVIWIETLRSFGKNLA